MNTPSELTKITEMLRNLDDSSVDKCASSQYLEIERVPDSEDIRINGNCQGLIHFARSVLEIAAKGFDGAHQHFDNVVLDRCDVPLIVRLKQEK